MSFDLKKWREFKEPEEKVLYEIDEDEVDKIADYVSAIPSEKLSFNNVFGEKKRIMIPFRTPADIDVGTPFGFLLQLFKHAKAEPNFADGTVSTNVYIPKIGEYKKKTYRIGKWISKLNHVAKQLQKALQSGNDKEWNDLRDKHVDEFGQNVILFQAEYLVSRTNEIIDFWNKKSEYYRQNPDAAEGESDKYSIIISRAPLDVLRMSDFASIESCHSPHGRYFHCAIAEARGHGLVAYVVDNQEWQEFVEEEEGELQDDEIFEDDDRGITGIVPLSRLRLRKFAYQSPFDKNIKYMAVPEKRAYGKKFPKFLEEVTQWARTAQEEVAQMIETGNLPEKRTMVRYGGSYEDTGDGTLLGNLFDTDTYGYGNVTHNTDDEEGGMYDQYVHECNELQQYADQRLMHASVYHDVDDDGEGGAYVSFSGGVTVEFSRTLEAVPESRDRDIRDEITEILHNLGLYMAEEYDFDSKSVDINLFDHGYEPTPDGFSAFIDEVDRTIDDNIDEIRVGIERALMMHGYMDTNEYFDWVQYIEDEGDDFENFQIEADHESIWISQMEDTVIPVGDYIPDIVRLLLRTRSLAKQPDISEEEVLRLATRFITNAISDNNNIVKFQRKVITSIVDAARKAVYRQLQLPGFDIDSDTYGQVQDIVAPNAFRIQVHMRHIDTSLVLAMNISLEPDETDEEIVIARKFLEWADKNFYKLERSLKKNADEFIQAAIVQHMETTKDAFNVKEIASVVREAKKLIESEPYQDYVKKKHPTWKKNLVGKGGNKHKAKPFRYKVSMKRSKSAPPGAGGV